MLAGRSILVTGATSGIGRAAATKFVQEGARVVATGRESARLLALQEELGAANLLFIESDLTKPGECDRIAAFVSDAFGGTLHTLCNVAGILKGGSIGTVTRSNLVDNLSINTIAPFELMNACVPLLKTAPRETSPSIINVTSINGQTSFAGVASYCASKAAMDMLTKCAAVDLAPHGIRVNAVAPGVVRTELQKRGGLSEEAYQAFIERSITVTHPLASALQRVATPEEVAELMVFLASEKARFITGDIVKIDGGRSCLGAR